VGESVVILKQESRLCAERGGDGIPVDGIGKVDIEISDHWLAFDSHVSGRREIGLFDVLQLLDQRLLRRAPGAGIPLDGALVDHDGKCKAWMIFSLGHYELSSLIDRITGTIPINDHAGYAAADHVRHLALDLRRIGRTVADIHVVILSEPEHQVGVYLRCRAGV